MKTLLSVRVVKQWYRFPREAEEALSLELLKSRMDGALSYLV